MLASLLPVATASTRPLLELCSNFRKVRHREYFSGSRGTCCVQIPYHGLILSVVVPLAPTSHSSARVSMDAAISPLHLSAPPRPPPFYPLCALPATVSPHQVKAFPLVNDEHVRGLISRYNGAMMRLQHALRLARQGAGAIGAGGRGARADREGHSVASDQEKNRLQEENDHLQHKLADMRDR